MKINEILKEAVIKLKENDIEEPNSKARRLLAYVLKVNKEYLIINNMKEITPEENNKYKNAIEKLVSGVPIQYIIGEQEFMKLKFNVNKNVLIPQPDTEILVEEVIKIAKKNINSRILDLCTGSGAIAISIAEYIDTAQIVASDISESALEVAKKNDKKSKVQFIKSNLFVNIKGKFDIIVSNPPYLETSEIEKMSKEVQNEPVIALDGGKDGLDFYRQIIGQAFKYLNKDGKLCLEIGENQAKQVTNIIENTENYENICVYKDLAGNNRVIICKKKQKNHKKTCIN